MKQHRRQYEVTVKHPTGFHSGQKIITVQDFSTGTAKFLDSLDFGCSKDFPTMMTDEEAIKTWLQEHLCTVTKIVRTI